MIRSGNPRASLMAALAIAVAGVDAVYAAMPAPRKGGNRDYNPTAPKRGSAQAQEIAAHNAAVDLRKAEKLARKRARNGKRADAKLDQTEGEGL